MPHAALELFSYVHNTNPSLPVPRTPKAPALITHGSTILTKKLSALSPSCHSVFPRCDKKCKEVLGYREKEWCLG